jgi:hypothetical protein
LQAEETLEILRSLATLSAPAWVAGGVGVDFLVGRWTRPHTDVDLVAAEDDRAALTEALAGLGFAPTHMHGWHTRWTRYGRDVGELELDFFRWLPDGTEALVVCPGDALGFVPGRYPGVPGAIDSARFASLEGVTLRVVSAEAQWVLRHSYAHLHPGSDTDVQRVRHDLELLEQLLKDDERRALQRYVGRRLPLVDGDC